MMSSKAHAISQRREVVENEIGISFNSTMEILETIWGEIGYTEERIKGFFDEVLQHVKALWENMVEEEKISYLKIKHRIKTYKTGLDLLCSELNEEAYDPKEALSLLQKEKLLRAQMDDLMVKKQTRIMKYKQMQKRENQRRRKLETPKKAHVSASILKQKELCKLEQRIRKLSDRKANKRYKKYWAAKKKLSIILEETDFVPETALDREVICYNENEDHELPEEKIDQLNKVLGKVEQFQQKVKADIIGLSEKLDNLWDQLNVDKETRDKFKTKHSAFRRSTIIALKSEIERCEELKIQETRKKVHELRGKLMDLWQKCFVSTQEKYGFEPFYSEKYSIEVVHLHEIEVARLEKYYDETKRILKKINRQQEIWDRMIGFERKACDPHRFQNRGGNLLQEEKERKKLLKDLPTLEKEIFQDIGEYEQKTGSLFLVNGTNFSDFIKTGRNKHQKEKEINRTERHSVKMNSQTVQRASGIGPVFGAPASAPGKIMSTNVDSHSFIKQPLTAVSKKLPSQSCNKIVKRAEKPLSTIPRPVLKETLKDDVKCSASTSNTTPYADCAMELDKDHMKHYHKNTAFKQKVSGSKISHNGSFKQSCSSTSSSQNRSETVIQPSVFKTKCRTPTQTIIVRGKLGLPFLL